MVFTSVKKKYDSDIIKNKIMFDGKPIVQVHSTKFLGIHITEHLSWLNHIQQVENKISKICGVLSKLKYVLPKNVLLSLYNTLLLPYLEYCAIIWAGSSPNQMEHIFKIQKRAVRNICMTDARAHTAPLFKKLRILKIHDIFVQQITQFMYKFNNNLLPENFNNYFIKNSTIHQYNTRHADNLHLPFSNTVVRFISIKSRGPRIWNALADDLKYACSLIVFKMKLKLTFINTYL